MKPLVSVIMPAYNAGKYISEAVESILNQTYDSWELIIVEDGSSDNTLDIVNTYQDNRVKLFSNNYNLGIADATNRGIEESKGKYIALLDDDDIAEKDRLQLQVDYLEQHPEIDILGGRTTYIDSWGNTINYSGIPRRNPKYIKAILLFNCMDFVNSTAMMRKEFIEKNHLYYRNGCYGMQDYRFYMESSKLGNISSLENFLLRHRIHKESTTNLCLEKFKQERKEVYAQFQRESISLSGFQISDRALYIINKALAETDGKCDSMNELRCLFEAFKELLKQGKLMKIDYYDELNHVCRVKLAEQVVKFKGIFGDI